MRLRDAPQFHASVAAGDAIGNDMFELQRLFWTRGVASDIYAWEARPGTEPLVLPWTELGARRRDSSLLLVHVSMGNDTLSQVAVLPHRKAVVYHNITPARFFSGVNDSLARDSDLGRRQLRELARTSELGIADSEFNRLELEEAGFSRTAVVPILVDWSAFGARPDQGVLRSLDDGRTHILVVGQVLPQKAVHDAVAAFARYRVADPTARLHIVGPHHMSGPYLDVVRGSIERHGVAGAADLTGSVPLEQLVAYYRGSSALLTMSEHEGFCVPLLEAMRSGLPVVATAAGAIPETMGDAGILVEGRSSEAVAAALERAVRDRELRRELVARGQRRVEDFSREKVATRLEDALAPAGWDLPPRAARSISVVSSDQRCGIHHYSLALCDGLRANGHEVTFVGVRHLDSADMRRKLSHIARGDVVIVEHEAGIFRDVPFVAALAGLWRRRHQIVLSLHEVEPEKFHHFRRISAALHYRPRRGWLLELVRIFWVAARIASWFVRYRAVLWLMGAIPDRLAVHSFRSRSWLDLLSREEAKQDEFPLVLMPLEDTIMPETPEARGALRRELGLPQDRSILISPGFFFSRKRLVEVIEATPDDAVLVLSGTASAADPEYYQRVMAAARARPNVIVNEDYDSMGRYVAASDAVVLYYEHVFQSAVAAQAIWAGLPCVFSTAEGFAMYRSAGLVAADTAALRDALRQVREPATNARLRHNAGILRRLLSAERLAPRYLVGLD